MVIQWESALLEFLKKVSGIQIRLTMLVLRVSALRVLLKRRRRSYHVWAKKMSMVYSWGEHSRGQRLRVAYPGAGPVLV